MKIEVNKDTSIGELIMIDQGVVPILMAVGMHCIGCPASQMETIEEAAMVHGIEPQSLVDEINDYLNSEKEEGEKSDQAS